MQFFQLNFYINSTPSDFHEKSKARIEWIQTDSNEFISNIFRKIMIAPSKLSTIFFKSTKIDLIKMARFIKVHLLQCIKQLIESYEAHSFEYFQFVAIQMSIIFSQKFERQKNEHNWTLVTKFQKNANRFELCAKCSNQPK